MKPPRDRFPVNGAIERKITVPDGPTLRSLIRGNLERGPVFVLVHGLASNARMWDGVAAALEAAGHSSVAIDLRGHGLSDKPDDSYDFDTVVADIVAAVHSLGVEQAILVGQSWGGNIAVHGLHQRPDVFTSGVAVDGGFIELAKSFPSWDDCARQLQPPRLAGTRASRLESAIRSMNSDWPESGLIGALSNFEYHEDGTLSPWLSFDRHMTILRELWMHRPSAMFSEISQPLLFLPADSGDVSWTRNKEHAIDAALEMLERGRAHWFRPAHHDLHAQFPDRTAHVLITHLEEGFLR
ncbi:MAG: alpha/beta fold hydrolase [Actinomycetota bacterium]